MIIDAKITNRPNSGDFKERIYDNESPWNSQAWTWVKFLEKDGGEWIGNFRGNGNSVALSAVRNEIVVLTSDYAFRINTNNGDVIEIEGRPLYKAVTISPDGTIVLADYYYISKTNESLKESQVIKSPIKMDMIEFKEWTGNILEFKCDEFLNENKKNILMELDSKTWEIKEKNKGSA